MDGKIPAQISPFATYSKATPRNCYAKPLATGVLVGAVMFLTFKHSSLASTLWGQPANTWGPGELRDWITHEATFSERKIFDRGIGAGEGLVVASPSTSHPDYFYTWTRYVAAIAPYDIDLMGVRSDSALVTASIMDRLVAGENELEAALRLYSYSQAKLQNTCNKSGLPDISHTLQQVAYVATFCQDGPALRAITLIRFANYLLDRGTGPDRDFVSRFLYNQDTSAGNSVIKNDLEYTSHMCFDTSYDLWEEKQDLFTLVACRKALSSGAALANRLGDSGAAAWYKQQFNVMTSRILDSGMFYFPDGSYRAYANPQKLDRRGVDSAVLLAIIAAGEPGDPNFGPTSPAVLASVKVYVDAFRGMYPIANSSEQSFGIAPVPTGRYPGEPSVAIIMDIKGLIILLIMSEDKWDGYETGSNTLGNPWYLCTVAVPHVSGLHLLDTLWLTRSVQLIDWALVEFTLARNITVTDVSLPFFKQFASVKMFWPKGVPCSIQLSWGCAPGQMGSIKFFSNFKGQAVYYTNSLTGASNLTWSFAAFASAAFKFHFETCNIPGRPLVNNAIENDALVQNTRTGESNVTKASGVGPQRSNKFGRDHMFGWGYSESHSSIQDHSSQLGMPNQICGWSQFRIGTVLEIKSNPQRSSAPPLPTYPLVHLEPTLWCTGRYFQ
ncbi:glycosyl hydrolases family 15 domain-containing protein [Rhizoctonia solani AG-1 IA]|uniref:glucan 1,4-alpha-glucosidase n=1 Tax=Thanatephorus cucumeris (strain AG1-IA) TaxID=983506 RepID=L8WUC9_THACA|nr:glycosyl hydrolases family 15 domain-containing protein [Rhizoctonia solani AG-1 IA]